MSVGSAKQRWVAFPSDCHCKIAIPQSKATRTIRR